MPQTPPRQQRPSPTPTHLLGGWVWLLWLPLCLALVGPTQAQETAEPHQAGLVVVTETGDVQTACITFSEAKLTGYDLLVRSGIPLETMSQGMGTAVCRLGETGCPASNCFCQCRGNECRYWSYWLWQENTWQYAQIGPSISPVQPGDVQGWSWGPGSVDTAVTPPIYSLAELCPAAAPLSPSPTPPSPLPPTAPTSYLAFGLMVVGLGVAWWLRRRAGSPHQP